MEKIKEQLKELLKKKAIIKGKAIKLASGKVTNIYIDARQVTLDPLGAYLAAYLLLKVAAEEQVKAIGGPTLGADPLVAATVVLSYVEKQPLAGFLVRKEAKKHGLQRQIEGLNLTPGLPVLLVEDVVTTGNSILQAAEAVKATGAQIKLIISLVDRGQGGAAALTKAGYRYFPLLGTFSF